MKILEILTIVRKIKSGWYPIKVCVECEKILGNYDIMHNQGICPKCGNSANSTVTDTKRIVLRYTSRYYLFLGIIPYKEDTEYKAANEESAKWLKQNNLL